jgi:hypothetical protein
VADGPTCHAPLLRGVALPDNGWTFATNAHQ